MGVRNSVPVFTSLALGATLVGVLEAAQPQSTQLPTPPRSELQPRQRPQPLFPVQPFAAPQPQQPRLDPRAPALPLNPDTAPTPPTLPNQGEPLILKPRIVCGMTLIPMAPHIDPKIGQKRDSDRLKDPTTYTIRPVQPSICW